MAIIRTKRSWYLYMMSIPISEKMYVYENKPLERLMLYKAIMVIQNMDFSTAQTLGIINALLFCCIMTLVDFIHIVQRNIVGTRKNPIPKIRIRQGTFWVWAQPMRGDIIMYRILSLTESISRMIPVWRNKSH